MASVALWLEANWLSLIQSVGIVGGLLFTAFTLRRDSKARRASDLLTLAAQHRELWSEVHRRPDLRRINDANVDLVSHPITPEEEEFLNLVFVHIFTTWLLSQGGAMPLLPIESLAVDVRSFVKQPLPHFVWQSSKNSRDPRFVRFVEECIAVRPSR